MLKTILKYCLLLGLALGPADVLAQAPLGLYTDKLVLMNDDTLILNRRHGDWWFGITGGTTYSKYFGDLSLPRNNNNDSTMPAKIIDFSSAGDGFGGFVGLSAEWAPPGGMWGAGVGIKLFDYRTSKSSTDIRPDGYQTHYTAEGSYHYISISPMARYNTPLTGLQVLGGLDFDINYSSEMHLVKNLVNNGKIDQRSIVPGDAASLRFGAFAGAGYEFYAIDFNHRFRVNMEPYVTVHAGTNVYNNYGSSLNSFFVRAGFSIKLGPDNIKYDTLRFDPDYKLKPVIVAKAYENEIHFPGFERPELVAVLIEPLPKFVPVPLYVDTQKVAIDITPPKKIDSEQPAPEPGKLKLVFSPRQRQIQKVFNSFRKPEDVRLTKDMRDYLDAVADFMREHPRSEVRIVGHSDKFGTLEQNTERSKKRAEEAKRYLMSKGISSGRIFERGVGSTVPLINNERPGGASKNRRVEITVVGK